MINKTLAKMKTSFIPLMLNIINLGAGLRIASLDVPKYAKVGDNIRLVCDYASGVDQVYSVKWYKDNMEFYRYVPKDTPKAQSFFVEGVNVNLANSNHKSVEISNVDLRTHGTLMCEVSSEAPRFKTVEANADLTIVLPPSSPPLVTPQPAPGHRYRLGDMLEVNCTSPPSSPPAKLRYFINNEMDDGSHTVMNRHIGLDGLISPTLSLSIRLTRYHFQGGIMRLRCEAIIYTVWGESTEVIYPGEELGEKALERILRGNQTKLFVTNNLILFSFLSLFIINKG